MWSIKVPSKIRVFLWRLAKHSIPTADVRHRRHMAQMSACSICGGQDSWKHSLLECNMARCVWALQSDEIVEFISQARDDNARGWLHEAIRGLDHDHRVRLFVSMWAIWYWRKLFMKTCFKARCQLTASSRGLLQTWRWRRRSRRGWAVRRRALSRLRLLGGSHLHQG